MGIVHQPDCLRRHLISKLSRLTAAVFLATYLECVCGPMGSRLPWEAAVEQLYAHGSM